MFDYFGFLTFMSVACFSVGAVSLVAFAVAWGCMADINPTKDPDRWYSWSRFRAGWFKILLGSVAGWMLSGALPGEFDYTKKECMAQINEPDQLRKIARCTDFASAVVEKHFTR